MNRYQKFYETWWEAQEDAGLLEEVMFTPNGGYYLTPDWIRIHQFIDRTSEIKRILTGIFILLLSLCGYIIAFSR